MTAMRERVKGMKEAGESKVTTKALTTSTGEDLPKARL
jgi:hypothetical protein